MTTVVTSVPDVSIVVTPVSDVSIVVTPQEAVTVSAMPAVVVVGGIGGVEAHNVLEVLYPGYTVWTLSKVPVNPELSELYLNGQKQRFLYDYSINGQILIWQTITLSPTDYLEINYRCH